MVGVQSSLQLQELANFLPSCLLVPGGALNINHLNFGAPLGHVVYLYCKDRNGAIPGRPGGVISSLFTCLSWKKKKKQTYVSLLTWLTAVWVRLRCIIPSSLFFSQEVPLMTDVDHYYCNSALASLVSNNALSVLPHSRHSGFHGHFQLLCGGAMVRWPRRVNLYCRLASTVYAWQVSCLVGCVTLAVVIQTALFWKRWHAARNLVDFPWIRFWRLLCVKQSLDP